MYARIVNLQQQPHLELGREQKKKSKGRKKSYYTKAILFHSQKLKSKTSNQAKWRLTRIIVTQFHIYILSRSTDARSIQLSLVTSSILTTCFLIIRRLAGRQPQGVGSLWWSVKQLGSTISIILNHTVWVNNHCDAQSYSLGEWSLWCSQSGWMITGMLCLGEWKLWHPIIQSGWNITVIPNHTVWVNDCCILNHTTWVNDQCDIQSYSLREWSVWYSIIQTGWMTTAIPNHTVWVNDYCILNHTVWVNDHCDTQSYRLGEWSLWNSTTEPGWQTVLLLPHNGQKMIWLSGHQNLLSTMALTRAESSNVATQPRDDLLFCWTAVLSNHTESVSELPRTDCLVQTFFSHRTGFGVILVPEFFTHAKQVRNESTGNTGEHV